MASIFWDYKGILLIDYLPNGQKITEEYYSNLLNQLDGTIREKRPGLNKIKSFFTRTMRVLIHLAPSDFYLFSSFKKFLSGKRFSSIEELQKTVDGYFEGLEENHFKEGIEAMESRWKKCIELEGEYVE
uniref:Uncharacterized protein n=1 Tax=Strongyloides venezuelensis TaxID=75913 RepID=A0A0K0FT80_STRVS